MKKLLVFRTYINLLFWDYTLWAVGGGNLKELRTQSNEILQFVKTSLKGE